VIQLGAAASELSRVDDSAGVGHEETSIHGNGKRSVGNQVSGHGLLRSSIGVVWIGEASVVGQLGPDLVLVEFASSILSSVRIRSLSHDSSPAQNISHSNPWPTTTASLVADGSVWGLVGAGVRAINNELLREGHEFLGLDSVDTLNVSDG